MLRRTSPNGDRQPDLFAASFADIPVRDQRDTMERPFFSLAKKPRLTPIEYKVGNVWVEVSANPKFGMATIWDADILIWASTQITEALDRGLTPSRTIKFHPYNLLNSIRRTTGGADYTRLRAALDRLTHTAVRTNIRAEGRKKFASFHWLESWTETIDERTGEPSGMTITLPDWLYSGVIERGGVLTIHEDYFLLTGGIERWLYRVARKHAGKQETGWSFTMRQLHEKSGSIARFSDFAIDIRRVVQTNQLPEYELSIRRNDEDEEIVYFVHRSKLAIDHPRFEAPRFPGRRHSEGIFAETCKLNALSNSDSSWVLTEGGNRITSASDDTGGDLGKGCEPNAVPSDHAMKLFAETCKPDALPNGDLTNVAAETCIPNTLPSNDPGGILAKPLQSNRLSQGGHEVSPRLHHSQPNAAHPEPSGE